MKGMSSSLMNKILLFNILIVLPLSLVVCFYLTWHLKTFAVKEKSKILSQLNEQATLYLGYSAGGSLLGEGEENSRAREVVETLTKNSDFIYAVVINPSDPSNPHFLHNRDSALQSSDLFTMKPQETKVERRQDMLHVLSPIIGYNEKAEETTIAFLHSGFSLESMKEEIRKTNYIIVGLCLGFIVLGIISGFIQSRLLMNPRKRTIDLIQTVAQGDFSQRLEFASQDELGKLMQGLNSMVSTWKQSIEKIKGTIDLSKSASREISIAANQREKVTIKEASSVNEITTTIEELNSSSKEVSEKAEQVAKKSQDVLKIALDGQHSVDRSIEEFNAIRGKVNVIAEHILNLNREGQQIEKIVGEVSNIANKTDMLATNAGIEAARAGEYGKGFSVVAAEIRNLANQSQKSAAKISSLIEKIQISTKTTMMATEQGTEGVEEGIKLILETGRTLESSIANMRETVDSVQEIALSSRQQSLGTDQVSEAMVSINEGMKETADAAKLTLMKSERLQSLSLELQEMINSYKV